MPHHAHRSTRLRSIPLLVTVSLIAAQAVLLSAATISSSAAATVGTITEFRPTGISQTATSDPLGITTGPDGNLWFVDAGASTIGFWHLGAASVQERATNTPNATPVGIASDGTNLWFTELSGSVNQVGRQTTSIPGTQNEFGINKANALPTGIVKGPDGNMWFTDFGNGTIGRISPSAGTGTLATTFSITNPALQPQAITSGPNGNLWFTEQGTNGGKIGEMNTSGVQVADFQAAAPSGAGIDGITVGPDGNLWFTEQNAGLVGKMTPSGVTQTFGTGIGSPTAITKGSDGNLWFIDQGNNAIGKITTAGAITEIKVPTANAFSPRVQPTGITSGPDGNIYFTENDAAAAIGEVTVASSTAGSVTASPTSISFGNQTVGSTSAAKTITLSNGTTATVSVNPVSIGGANASQFNKVTDSCSGAVLAANGGSCSVSVSFAPKSAASFTAAVNFSEAGGGTQSVALSGTGVSSSGGGGGGGGGGCGLLGLIAQLLHLLLGIGTGC